MVTTPLLSTAQLRHVLAAATGADGGQAAVEACGLLLGHGAAIDRLVAARNVSATPHDSFEIDPAVLIAAYRAERSGGRALLGCWHTHPSGDPAPSRRDALAAAADGRLWLIATAREARLWRAVPDGAVHGRFHPVRFDVTDGAPGDASGVRVEKNVAGVQHRGAGRELTFLSGRGNDI